MDNTHLAGRECGYFCLVNKRKTFCYQTNYSFCTIAYYEKNMDCFVCWYYIFFLFKK